MSIQPAIVQNLEVLFQESLEQAGVSTKNSVAHHHNNTENTESKSSWFGRKQSTSRPYTGPDPPCIRELMKGVREGLRNDAAFRVACYLDKVRKLDPKRALRRFKEFNRLNDTPLENKELERVFISAIHGNYAYGCKDDILRSLCDPQLDCPFRDAENEKAGQTTAVFDAETERRIEAEVRTVLEAENLIKPLMQHLDAVIVEEKNNKATIMVLLTGSRYGTPDKLVIIVLKGGSRGGKSHLAGIAMLGYREKKVGRFTTHALDYSDLEPYDILYVQELADMDKEKSGQSTLKLLSGDDQGYSVEYPVRDEQTGVIRNEERRIPAKDVVSTTTRISIEHQFENRSWLFPIDESVETSRKILEWKAERKRQEDEKLLEKRKITDYEFSKEVITRVIRQIKPHKLIIPFRRTITKIFKPESSLRIRGDIDKVYTFIELYGNLNIKRLTKLRVGEEEVYAVTPEVAVEALELVKGIISQMLAGIEPRTKEVLEALNRVEEVVGYTEPKHTGEASVSIKEHPNKEKSKIDKSTREDVARLLGVSEDTVRNRLNALRKRGYLSSDEGKGRKGKMFNLLYDVSVILSKLTEESGISMSPHLLIEEMEKEAREFLNSQCGIQSETARSENSPSSDIAEARKDNSDPPRESNPHSDTEENQGGLEQRTEKKAENEKPPISNSCSHCKYPIEKGKLWSRLRVATSGIRSAIGIS
jgi:biotin operon repressor